jgi:PTS system trehalose-specific IIC component
MSKVEMQQVRAIIEAVGGKDNIRSATHCVSRLRLQLTQLDKVNEQALKALPLVKGTVVASNQFQVIIGQGTVDKVYEIFNAEIASGKLGRSEKDEVVTEKKGNVFARTVALLGAIFMPLLPALVASGLLLGINNVLTGPGIFGTASLVELYPQIEGIAGIISLIAGTGFAFLPALVSWSIVQRFGGNPLMGIVLGLVLVHPDLLNGYVAHTETPELWHIVGLDVAQIGYQGQVLPALIAGFAYAKLEGYFKRIIPETLQMFFVSTLSLLLTSLLAFIVIGPTTYYISARITDSIVTLANFSLPLTGFLFSGTFSLLVLSGMHHAFLPVNIQLIASTGGTIFWPFQALADLAQGTAAFVVGFLQKQSEQSSIAYSAGLSAYLGITEPAMFGVNLKAKYPFIAAMIGAACGGGFIGASAVSAPAIGVSGALSFLAIARADWQAYIIGMVITIVLTAVLTIFFAFVLGKRGKTQTTIEKEGIA